MAVVVVKLTKPDEARSGDMFAVETSPSAGAAVRERRVSRRQETETSGRRRETGSDGIAVRAAWSELEGCGRG